MSDSQCISGRIHTIYIILRDLAAGQRFHRTSPPEAIDSCAAARLLMSTMLLKVSSLATTLSLGPVFALVQHSFNGSPSIVGDSKMEEISRLASLYSRLQATLIAILEIVGSGGFVQHFSVSVLAPRKLKTAAPNVHDITI